MTTFEHYLADHKLDLLRLSGEAHVRYATVYNATTRIASETNRVLRTWNEKRMAEEWLAFAPEERVRNGEKRW